MTEKVKFTFNGKEVVADKGANLLKAILNNDHFFPRIHSIQGLILPSVTTKYLTGFPPMKNK